MHRLTLPFCWLTAGILSVSLINAAVVTTDQLNGYLSLSACLQSRALDGLPADSCGG